MGIRLFVGNLSFAATEDSLRERFAGDDRVVQAVRIMMDRETGRPRGFAFVDMADEAQAQAAIDQLDGSDFEGRAMRVSLATERPERGPSRGGPGGDRGERSGPPRERTERRDSDRPPPRSPSEFRGPPRSPSGGGDGGGVGRRFDNDRGGARGGRDRETGGRGGRDQGRRSSWRDEGTRDEGRRSRRPRDDDDDDWE
jgi:RNA recognition motif-containing protein